MCTKFKLTVNVFYISHLTYGLYYIIYLYIFSIMYDPLAVTFSYSGFVIQATRTMVFYAAKGDF